MSLVLPSLLLVPLLATAALAEDKDSASSPVADYKSAAGPFSVGTVERLTLRDEKRGKDLHVFVSFPKGDGPFPVIVFSHGAMGSGDMGFPLVTHWSSHGYAVLCPTHADSIKLQRSEGKTGTNAVGAIRGSGRGGSWDDNWTERPRDVSLVIDSLDRIEAGVPGLKGRLDRARVGVGGHSLGAYTAQVVGGATLKVPGNDAPQSFADKRVKAVLQLSGQGTDQQGLHKDSWRGMDLPMMCVTGSLDRAAQGQEPLWRREPFAYSPPGGKYFVFVEGAHHGSFTGKFADAGSVGGFGGATNRVGTAGRMGKLSDEQKAKLRERFQAKQAEKKPDTDTPPRSAAKGAALGRGGDQQAIFDWVKQSTTAFWDSTLKKDANAAAWLKSDALVKLADGKLKLERK